MPSPITFRHPAMRELCEVLGVSLVRSFTLSADLEEPVTITIERLVTDEEADGIRRVLSSHHLVLDDGEVWEDEPLQSGAEAFTQADDFKKYAR